MKALHVALAILVMAIWGFNLVVIKVGLEEIPPLLLCFLRFFLLSIPAIFFIRRPAIPFKMILGYGLVMFALQYGLLFLGMYAGVTAGLASILLQLQVFFTIFLGVLFFGEKLHLWQILGALVSFSGIVSIVVNLGGDITLLGLLLVIGSGMAWGAGNLISKKIGKVSTGPLVIWSSLVAWPPFLLMVFSMEDANQIFSVFQNLNWLSIGAVLYITFISTLVAFGVWSWLLHQYPMGTIAPFTLLIPVFGILSSVLALGEPLQSWKIAAAILVIGGLGINLLGPRIFSKKRF